MIDERPELVLAEAWLLHHRAVPGRRFAAPGSRRGAPAADALGEHARLGEEARLGLQGEIDALTSQLVYWTADAERTLALAQRALAVTPIEHSYVRAIARMFAAAALQMRGDIRGAIADPR